LYPPPAPPAPPPDPKLLIAPAKAQSDQAIAVHQAQIQQQKAQKRRHPSSVKTKSEIALAKIKADLDAKMAVLEAHLMATTEAQRAPRSYPPGARKARDGHHYVVDPKQPGKFLMVVHHGCFFLGACRPPARFRRRLIGPR
jgi:hypothetical protein